MHSYSTMKKVARLISAAEGDHWCDSRNLVRLLS